MKKKVFKDVLNYNGEKVKCLLFQHIGSRRNELVLETLDGKPHSICSLNIDVELQKDEVLIKNHSEGMGILEFLIKNNVISHPKKCVILQELFVPACKIVLDNFTDKE